ncbi:hypothetical protein JR316_0007509 [Psilocybe cubensis]|uniref:Uncharacterized protein n=4 Tax=Psilocybe cubensis TaxID=181762 RepID=A0A8H7XHV9_PSICU|nr:uncharacterized protein JR316_0013499 [Psilocybe cubensis]XP_047743785.1 hypothetical protein JR316_0011731 [Psilocybe cubensis]XP_047748532.1 hypothetical protein JR316_0007509 [Psilocybe cubensis]KAH9474226.1 hypothetical protein JR316_0013499 [Psilocybe cubensis]KAH9476160.1 hypothetical protein JR316_0011731 [Psilocybe cubensis]KAH9480907.1 hypothetical protein JR316_0007509 [Psilocybe cubensis]
MDGVVVQRRDTRSRADNTYERPNDPVVDSKDRADGAVAGAVKKQADNWPVEEAGASIEARLGGAPTGTDGAIAIHGDEAYVPGPDDVLVCAEGGGPVCSECEAGGVKWSPKRTTTTTTLQPS